jgi:hypothetical protein
MLGLAADILLPLPDDVILAGYVAGTLRIKKSG